MFSCLWGGEGTGGRGGGGGVGGRGSEAYSLQARISASGWPSGKVPASRARGTGLIAAFPVVTHTESVTLPAGRHALQGQW